jgi:hypothetical protein
MGRAWRESASISKELGIHLPFDMDEKIKIYQDSRETVRKKIQNWDGSDAELNQYLEKVKRFFGGELVKSWVNGGRFV